MGLSKPASSKRSTKTKRAPDKKSYLITLSIKDDAEPLAHLEGKNTVLNERGQKLLNCWRGLEKVRPGILPDSALISERHFQGLILLTDPGEEAALLADSIRFFKLLSSQQLSHSGKAKTKLGVPLWKIGYSVHKV